MGNFGPDPFEDLPDDPEEAFLILEEHFREECNLRLQEAGHDERTDVIHVAYISQVLAALGLEAEFKSEVPSIESVSYNTYLDFNKDVMHYRTMLRIRKGQRRQGYSVRFDDNAKRKVHHHLDQVLEIFNRLEVEDTKRERLISCLNDLQAEVNQPRTRFDHFAALSIEVSSVVGEIVDRTKVLDLLDAVARVFWGAQTERQKQLPQPKQPKLEPPKPKIDRPKRSDMEDDIPF